MTKKWQYLCRCLLVLVFIGGVIPAKAQLVERVCRTDYKISPERKGELLLELDNISFFKDNEFAGTVIKGYSLPGLWIQPKFVYYPLKKSNWKEESICCGLVGLIDIRVFLIKT